MTDVDWELVFRYFGSECSPAERERFERWLAADPGHRRIVDAAIATAGRTSRTLTASFTNEPLGDVLSALAPVLDVRVDRAGDTVVVRPAR